MTEEEKLHHNEDTNAEESNITDTADLILADSRVGDTEDSVDSSIAGSIVDDETMSESSTGSPMKSKKEMKKAKKKAKKKRKHAKDDATSVEGPLSIEQATKEERDRFIEAFHGNPQKSEDAILSYLRWRSKTFPIPESALDFGRGIHNPFQLLKDKSDHCVRTNTNKARVLWLWGAMYDVDIEAEDYAIATAALLDRYLERDSMEKISIVIDGRPNESRLFKNPSAWGISSYAKICSRMFSENFPERLDQVILFPMPWYARAIWAAIKPFLDERTAEKVVLLDGKLPMGAPVPDTLYEFVNEEYIPEAPTGESTVDNEYAGIP